MLGRALEHRVARRSPCVSAGREPARPRRERPGVQPVRGQRSQPSEGRGRGAGGALMPLTARAALGAGSGAQRRESAAPLAPRTPRCTTGTLQVPHQILPPAPRPPSHSPSHSPSLAAAPGPLPPAAAGRQILPERGNLLRGRPTDAPSPPGRTAMCQPQVGGQAEGGWLHSAWQCQPLPQHPGCLRSSLATGFLPQRPAEHRSWGTGGRAHGRGVRSPPPPRKSPFRSLPQATACAPRKPASGTTFSNSAPRPGLSVRVWGVGGGAGGGVVAG